MKDKSISIICESGHESCEKALREMIDVEFKDLDYEVVEKKYEMCDVWNVKNQMFNRKEVFLARVREL